MLWEISERGWSLFNEKRAIFQLYHGENKYWMRWWWPLCIRPARWVRSL